MNQSLILTGKLSRVYLLVFMSADALDLLPLSHRGQFNASVLMGTILTRPWMSLEVGDEGGGENPYRP